MGNRRSRPVSRCIGLLALGAVAASACSPELSRISAIDKIRVLGVKKSAPYARPGETVTLRMLWEDGANGPPRDVETFFAFWCVNPPGDAYSGCFSQLDRTPEIALNTNETSVTIPEDILRPSAADPNYPPYGVAYVFFGVCAGSLQWLGQDVGIGGAGGALGGGPSVPDDLPDSGEGIPSGLLLPSCMGADGEPLGADDFLVGYSGIFAYEDFRNRHPVVTGFEVGGKEVSVDCIDEACDGPFAIPDLDDCAPGVACIEACTEKNRTDCPEIEIGPLFDRASIERDEIAERVYGADLEESMWVSYFVDRGELRSDLRLLNDAEKGFNPDYQATFTAPEEPGPLRLWAAVRDNRGGIAWVRAPAFVRGATQ